MYETINHYLHAFSFMWLNNNVYLCFQYQIAKHDGHASVNVIAKNEIWMNKKREVVLESLHDQSGFSLRASTF